MIVTEVALYRYRLPLVRPLILKGQAHHFREGLLMRIALEMGFYGWGEIAPLPGFSRETLEEAEAQTLQLLRALKARPIGEIWTTGSGPQQPSCIGPLLPSVFCGLKLLQYSLLPPPGGYSQPLGALLTGNEEAVLAKTTERVAQGYRAVKLKVGGRTIDEDVALVHRVHDRLQGKATLRLDANRAWTFEQALEFGTLVNAVPIEYVEEPLQNPMELPRLGTEWELPIALDESLAETDWEEIRNFPRLTALVIKATLVGSRIQCDDLGPCLGRLAGMIQSISSSFESPVGLWLLAHLAGHGHGYRLTSSFYEYPAGLDTEDWFAESTLTHPLPIVNGAMDLSRTVTDADIRMDALTEVFHA